MSNDKFDFEHFPTSKSAKKMMGYVTEGFYDRSYVGKWLFQVMGMEYDTVRKMVENLGEQFFPETATWGLMYHELKWGLPIRENLSYEERRKLIYQKRDCRSPITPYRLEIYLENATGFKVHVADCHDKGEYGFIPTHSNIFKVYLLGDGSVDSKLVHKIVNGLKQSHTIYTVNDRVEVVFDNIKIENIWLKGIRMCMRMPFFGCNMLDGTWLLDGIILLNQKRRYGLALGICCYIKVQIDMEIKTKAMRNKFFIENRMFPSIRMLYWIGIDFFYIFQQDLTECAGAILLKMKMGVKVNSCCENIGSITMTVKTHDYWFLDGSIKLDGVRNLNAVYEKEAIE